MGHSPLCRQQNSNSCQASVASAWRHTGHHECHASTEAQHARMQASSRGVIHSTGLLRHPPRCLATWRTAMPTDQTYTSMPLSNEMCITMLHCPHIAHMSTGNNPEGRALADNMMALKGCLGLCTTLLYWAWLVTPALLTFFFSFFCQCTMLCIAMALCALDPGMQRVRHLI